MKLIWLASVFALSSLASAAEWPTDEYYEIQERAAQVYFDEFQGLMYGNLEQKRQYDHDMNAKLHSREVFKTFFDAAICTKKFHLLKPDADSSRDYIYQPFCVFEGLPKLDQIELNGYHPEKISGSVEVESPKGNRQADGVFHIVDAQGHDAGLWATMVTPVPWYVEPSKGLGYVKSEILRVERDSKGKFHEFRDNGRFTSLFIFYYFPEGN